MWASLLIRSGFKIQNFETIDLMLQKKNGEQYSETWYFYMAQKTLEKSLF